MVTEGGHEIERQEELFVRACSITEWTPDVENNYSISGQVRLKGMAPDGQQKSFAPMFTPSQRRCKGSLRQNTAPYNSLFPWSVSTVLCFLLCRRIEFEIDSALLFQSLLQNSLDQWSSHLECLGANQGIFSRAASRASHFLSVGGQPRTGVPALVSSSTRHTSMAESSQTRPILTRSSSLPVSPWVSTGPGSSLELLPWFRRRSFNDLRIGCPLPPVALVVQRGHVLTETFDSKIDHLCRTQCEGCGGWGLPAGSSRLRASHSVLTVSYSLPHQAPYIRSHPNVGPAQPTFCPKQECLGSGLNLSKTLPS